MLVHVIWLQACGNEIGKNCVTKIHGNNCDMQSSVEPIHILKERGRMKNNGRS